MALKVRGDYYYGSGPRDVWAYCVRRNRNVGMTPVTHWRQAVCTASSGRPRRRCGHKVFRVVLSEEDGAFAQRTCVKCGHAHEMLKDDTPLPEGYDDDFEPVDCVCVCEGTEFQVVGVTAPRDRRRPDTADWFYLGLRCVRCGCVGTYAYWQERYNDYKALLAKL
jgi:hypothetical protein